jgi:hypothetical protein
LPGHTYDLKVVQRWRRHRRLPLFLVCALRHGLRKTYWLAVENFSMVSKVATGCFPVNTYLMLDV